jgi:peptidoglycan/xylan/chitin deacetylase (PgdA/CDA1 family)
VALLSRTEVSAFARQGFGCLALCTALLASTLLSASTGLRSSFDHAATSEKIVALTFDADMTPGMLRELKSRHVASWYNGKVIETLRQEHVPATLFMTGLWIEAYGAATKELSADPLFELGNHSYSHGAFHSPCYHLFPIPESKQAAEVQKTDDLLTKNASSHVKYFRFPGLCFDAHAVKTVEDQGYTIIGGDVDGGDGFEKYAKPIVSNVVSHVRPGSIVVLHMHGGANAPETAVALAEIIKKLRAEGYSFVKVSDLLKFPPGEPIKPPAMPRQVATPPPVDAPSFFPTTHFFRR